MVDSLRGGLVVAPSNAAVANAALKLLSLGRFDARSVVIYGENCDDAVHFLSPGHRYKRFLSFKKEYESLQGKTEKQVDMFSAFVQWLRLDQEVTFPDLESICKRVDDTPKGQQALVDFIDKAKVVLCTMNTAGSHFIRQAVRGKFDTLFIDEAAQIPETEFYIATSFPGVKRIVLVGDPMQLGATVINIDCESAGYGESWFSHVMDVHPHKVHLLNVQYRCDQRIMQFSNINFYESAVRTSRSVIDRQPVFQHAIGWINTFPNGEEESVGTSYRNNFEAESVRRLLCSDDDIKLLIAQCKHPAIIVITPYRAQVDLLKKELSKVKSLEYVRVATVDSFQGQEGDIVIVSTVVSLIYFLLVIS